MPDERAPQQERSLARRAAILESAASVFDRVGYGSASLSQIATEAGLGQGLLYFYFRTKEAMALAVIQAQNERTFAVMGEHADPHSPLSTLVRASRGIGELLLSDAVVRAGIRLSLEQGVFAEPTSDFYDQWIQGVVDAFTAARDVGEINEVVAPERLGANVVAYFTGVQLVSNVRTGRQDLMGALDTMWSVLVEALATPENKDRLREVVGNTFGDPANHWAPVASDAVT
ncbi:ScbR family autoregulator-binding transcription factor [Curtobacterium sp. RHCJP20]|uniref:ScbR family autoregulator-binding transcription factor n=1 Tax=Curtobacterium subtropicum TaxID=3055138 RepID=A0ABT7TDP1_9MICO|nr:ScbR family autoregulator-binding transcription factor [Curtobacterium subtropicum]MDM7887696.1 ScbR family autoregulator-binding transcription factor [Curtobacterium subtropicum]